MFEIVKQAVFTSIGLASLTKDKIEELVAELSRRAQLTEEQAREFGAEVSRRADEARKNLDTEIDRRVNHALIQLGIVKGALRKAGDEARDEFQAVIDRRVDAALERLGVARTEDIEALTHRVERLEEKLESR